MKGILLLLSLLTPIPHDQPSKPFIAGTWDLQWGNIQQVVIVDKKGNYSSQPYGDGKYTLTFDECDDMIMLFNEGNNFYKLVVNKDGTGWGCRKGNETNTVDVTFTKRVN